MIELNVQDMQKAEREYEHIQEEVALIKTLKHRNIVGYVCRTRCPITEETQLN